MGNALVGQARGRMLQIEQVKAAADGVIAAALLAEGWDEALAALARAADARHAVLMRNTPQRVITSIANEEAKEGIANYMAGRAPPNSRYSRVDTQRAGAFRVDHDDYAREELARDPYYQEFLRPMGIFWHANAVLAPGRDEHVELSFKRGIELGPYHRADIVVLDSVLAELHAAARIAKRTLDAQTRGMVWLLRRRGEWIIEIDGHGRVLAGQWPGESDTASPLRVVGRRLVAIDRTAQPLLERAVARAVSRPGRLGLVPLVGPDGKRYLLQLHPAPGLARDVFLSAQAIAVLIERDRNPPPVRLDTSAIRDAFELTGREADVAALVCEGLSIQAIAERLEIQPDTARTYLRAVLEKTDTHRQAELVALLARL